MAFIFSLSDVDKTVVQVFRRIKYFVALNKFQQSKKPYDVRDIIEQHSQGHFQILTKLKVINKRFLAMY